MQVGAVDVFHHDEVDGTRRVEVERPGDVGMVEPGRRLRLALEPRQVGGLVDPLHGQHLDRHLIVERHMLCEVDAAHSPLPEQSQELVFAEHKPLMLPLAELLQLPGGQQSAVDDRLDAGLGNRARDALPWADGFVELI